VESEAETTASVSLATIGVVVVEEDDEDEDDDDEEDGVEVDGIGFRPVSCSETSHRRAAIFSSKA